MTFVGKELNVAGTQGKKLHLNLRLQKL